MLDELDGYAKIADNEKAIEVGPNPRYLVQADNMIEGPIRCHLVL